MQESGEDVLLKLASLLQEKVVKVTSREVRVVASFLQSGNFAKRQPSQKRSAYSSWKSKLSLTAVSVNYLNKCFKALADSSKQRWKPKDHHYFLYEFIQRTVSLKLLQGARFRLGMTVNVSYFKALRIIEIRRIPLEFVNGLSELRAQLQSLTYASGCIKILKDIFETCGRDLSGPFPWPNLTEVNLSFNSIGGVDESLKYLTVLRNLDLSHNVLCDSEQQWEELDSLRHLNLGFNNFNKIPSMNPLMRTQITVLIIKNNNLENLEGIQEFASLIQLDVSNNSIARVNDLGPLANLHFLTSILLCGNPISFHVDYRLNVVAHLSPIDRDRSINLDGKDLDFTEVSYLGYSVHPESPVSYIAPVTSPLEVTPPTDSLFNDSVEEDLLIAQQRQDYDEQLQLQKQQKKIKKPLTRVVSIADQLEFSDGEEEEQLQSEGASMEVESEYGEELEKIDKFRKQVGEDSSNNSQDWYEENIEHYQARKKRVVQLVLVWINLAKHSILQGDITNAFLDELKDAIRDANLDEELTTLHKMLMEMKSRFQNSECPSSPKINPLMRRAGQSSSARRFALSDIMELTRNAQYRSIVAEDENIFKVYCADHTYTTVRLPYDAPAATVVQTAAERLLLGDDCVLCEVRSSGEKLVLDDDEISVTSGLSVNGKLFIVPGEHIDSLTPLPEQEGPTSSTASQLEMWNSRDIAYQITSYDHELFSAINLYLGYSVHPESPVSYIAPVTSPLEVTPPTDSLFNDSVEEDLLIAQQRQDYDEQVSAPITETTKENQKPLTRVVSIADQLEFSDGEEEEQLQSEGASMEVESEYGEELEKIDKFRKQVGEGWLQAFPSLMEENTAAGKNSEISQTQEIQETPASPGLSVPLIVEVSPSIYDQPSHDDNVEDETELVRSESVTVVASGEQDDESPSFVVSMKTSEDCKDEPEPMFIVLKPEFIQEKNFNGVVVNLLDLKCLLHITTKFSESLLDETVPTLCLNFDYINKNNKYREYYLDDQDTLKDLMEILEPVVHANDERWIASRDSLQVRANMSECKSNMVVKGDNLHIKASLGSQSVSTVHSDSSVQVIEPFRNSGNHEGLQISRSSGKIKTEPDVIPEHGYLGEQDPDVCLTANQSQQTFHENTGYEQRCTEVNRVHSEKDKCFAQNKSTETLSLSYSTNNERTKDSLFDEICDDPKFLSKSVNMGGFDHSGAVPRGGTDDCKLSSSLPENGKDSSPSSGLNFFKTLKHVITGTPSSGSGESPMTSSVESRSSTPSMGKSVTRILISKDDYRSCDHRLRLHFEVSLFTGGADEEFKCILKCDVVIYGKSKAVPGLLVVSNKMAYICFITGVESSNPSEWLKLRCSLFLSDLYYLDYGLGSQSFRIEFDKVGAYFTFLIRDENRCEMFVNYFIEIAQEAKERSSQDLITINRLNPQTLANIRTQILGYHIEDMTDKGRRLSEQAVHFTHPPLIATHKVLLRSYPDCFSGREFVDWLIRCREVHKRIEGVSLGQQLLNIGVIYHINKEHQFDDRDILYRFNIAENVQNLDHKKRTSSADDDELDTSVQVYLLAYALPHWKQTEEPELCPISIIMTRSHVCLAEENFQWPLPRVQDPPPLDSPQFICRDKQMITDVSSLELFQDSPCHVGIIFTDETFQMIKYPTPKAKRAGCTSLKILSDWLNISKERITIIVEHINRALKNLVNQKFPSDDVQPFQAKHPPSTLLNVPAWALTDTEQPTGQL